MHNPKDIAEQLISSTVKLSINDGEAIGTGFFYKAAEEENGDFKPVIVSNRHVFQEAENVQLTLTFLNDKKEHYLQNFVLGNIKDLVIFHPNKNVDLAVIPIPGLLKIFLAQGHTPDSVFLNKSLIPNQRDLEDISAIEDIYIVGYPNGFMDEINNRPLVRKGITASDFKLDYNGEKKFLVDSAIFSGSSGSPVLIYNKGGFYDAAGNFQFGKSRVLLLGINSAVMIQDLNGELIEEDSPTKKITVSRMPIGLGIIVKSELLKDFDFIMPE